MVRRLMVLCLLVLSVGILGYRCSERTVYHFSKDARDGSYEMALPAIVENVNGRAKEETFQMEINARPEVNAQSGRCNLMIGNPEENKWDIRVELVLDETGTKIYESEVLQPGNRQAYITLDSIPKAGEHSVTAIFYLLGEDGETVVSEIDAGLLVDVGR